MPWLGLGVWQIPPSRTVAAVTEAFRIGYRHVDTAAIYGNEREVGMAVRESGLSREEIFVTTKVPSGVLRHTRKAFEESLERLGLEYVDLYLIHYPGAGRAAAWDTLVDLQKEGRAKAIGVSNYTVRHLKELMAASKTVPAVNQVEFSPFLYQRELLEFCRSKGIQLEAYSPLARGLKLRDRTLTAVAAKQRRTAAQVMLRWAVQRECVVIPKSARPERMEENASLFEFSLTEDEMRRLDSLDEGFRTCWDPSDEP